MLGSVVIEPQYFPPIAYFTLLVHAQEVYIDAGAYYQKQSYRNRCRIAGPQGPQSLSVPVHYHQQQPLHEVRIDYTHDWRRIHLGGIRAAYGKSPFFAFIFDGIQDIFQAKPKFLLDLSQQTLSLCLKYIPVTVNIHQTRAYVDPGPHIHDFRSSIHPKKDDNLDGFFSFVPYPQLFGSNFVENMSILDLLFVYGTESVSVLKGSFSGPEQKN